MIILTTGSVHGITHVDRAGLVAADHDHVAALRVQLSHQLAGDPWLSALDLLEHLGCSIEHLLVTVCTGLLENLRRRPLIGLGIVGIVSERRLQFGMARPEPVDNECLPASVAILDGLVGNCLDRCAR